MIEKLTLPELKILIDECHALYQDSKIKGENTKQSLEYNTKLVKLWDLYNNKVDTYLKQL